MSSFSALDIPHIDPQVVLDMKTYGSSIARGVIPEQLCLAIAQATALQNGKRIDLSHDLPRHSTTPIEAHIVALAVHEAFFQAGYTKWEPNLSVMLQNDKQNPHADLPLYKIGVALAYTSGTLDMQVATSLSDLAHPEVIDNIQAGDVLFLSAIMPGDEPANDVPDGRTWHNAVGGLRTMLHMGYEQ
jgi:hypothetical protein